jgi:hypothetical protein
LQEQAGTIRSGGQEPVRVAVQWFGKVWVVTPVDHEEQLGNRAQLGPHPVGVSSMSPKTSRTLQATSGWSRLVQYNNAAS